MDDQPHCLNPPPPISIFPELHNGILPKPIFKSFFVQTAVSRKIGELHVPEDMFRAFDTHKIWALLSIY